MRKRPVLIRLALVFVALIGAGTLFYLEAWPIGGALIIHAPQQAWTNISVAGGPEYGGFPETGMSYTPPRREIRVSPFFQGHHEIWVKFADGRFARLAFFHSVARAERIMDVYVSRDTKSTASMRVVFNGQTTVYSGAVAATDPLHPLPPALARM